MAITNGYATLAELKTALNISDTNDDSQLEIAVESASRAIDNYTGRRFWQDPTVVARYYSAEGRCHLALDDISTTTGLLVKLDDNDDGTFEVTLTQNTDFVLEPLNAAADGEPWDRIVLPRRSFPATIRSVEVTAKFGWAAVPTAVKQACLLQSGRLFVRRLAPFGVAGSPEMGSEIRLLNKLDPDVEVLVNQYRKYRWFPSEG